MKLSERVVMVALIKANYRRSMVWFIFNMFLLIASLVVVIYSKYFNPTLFSPIIKIIAGLTGIGEIIILPLTNIQNRGFPWVVKNREMKALDEGRCSEFEELLSSVPLNRYF